MTTLTRIREIFADRGFKAAFSVAMASGQQNLVSEVRSLLVRKVGATYATKGYDDALKFALASNDPGGLMEAYVQSYLATGIAKPGTRVSTKMAGAYKAQQMRPVTSATTGRTLCLKKTIEVATIETAQPVLLQAVVTEATKRQRLAARAAEEVRQSTTSMVQSSKLSPAEVARRLAALKSAGTSRAA